MFRLQLRACLDVQTLERFLRERFHEDCEKVAGRMRKPALRFSVVRYEHWLELQTFPCVQNIILFPIFF